MRTVVIAMAMTTALSPISGYAGSKNASASDDNLNPFEQVDRMPAETTESPWSSAPIESRVQRREPSNAQMAASGSVVWRPYVISSEQVEIVHRGVRAVLRDPVSAIFGAVRARISSAGTIAVCGMVNGKNGYGGYTGDELYDGILVGEEFTSVHIDEGGPLSDLSHVSCHHIGAM